MKYEIAVPTQGLANLVARTLSAAGLDVSWNASRHGYSVYVPMGEKKQATAAIRPIAAGGMVRFLDNGIFLSD